MAKLYNRVKVATATTGTGTVTLGAASSNAFCTFAEAGVANSDTVSYCIEEGTDFEIGTGVYTSAGTTMTRATVTISKISGTQGTTKMTLAGAATVRIIARKEDLLSVSDTQTANQVYAGPSSGSAAAPTFRAQVAADQPVGCVLQCLQNTYATNTNIATSIPYDDTTPLSSEGTQILSQAITPTDNSNTILCLVSLWGELGSASAAGIASLFRGSTCIQVASFSAVAALANDPLLIAFMYLDSPASASAQTYTVRVGNDDGTNMRLNGVSTGRKFGGTSVATLTVMEIAT